MGKHVRNVDDDTRVVTIIASSYRRMHFHIYIYTYIFRVALFEELMTVAELISVEFVEGASVGVSCCLEGRCSISDFRNDRTNSKTAS